MPPHCDTRDGPVVKAARKALESNNVDYVLIWVSRDAEAELRTAFERTMMVRSGGQSAQELADDWFFETTIRLHRAGEGAPYTGLKPAGLDEGPVVPLAEKAIETGDAQDVIRFITEAVREDLTHRFNEVQAKKKFDPNNVAAGRAYVAAFINFVVYSHHLFMSITGSGGNREQGETGPAGHHH